MCGGRTTRVNDRFPTPRQRNFARMHPAEKARGHLDARQELAEEQARSPPAFF